MIDSSYFKSAGAIFRTAAIVLGIVGLVLLAESRDTGRYYNLQKYVPTQAHESYCKMRNLEPKHQFRVCPPSALTFIANLLTGLCCVFAVVLLVLKIVLNNSGLQQFDFFGQIIAGVGFGLALIPAVSFLIMVYTADFPMCLYFLSEYEKSNKGRRHKSYSEIKRSMKERYGDPDFDDREVGLKPSRQEPSAEEELNRQKKICSIQRELDFQQNYIIFGCIFVLAAAVLCLLAPLFEKRQGGAVKNYGGRGGQANSGGGNYGPPQFQSQSVVPPSKVEGVPIEKPSIENPKPED